MFALIFRCYRHNPVNIVFPQSGYVTKVLALYEQGATEGFGTLLIVPPYNGGNSYVIVNYPYNVNIFLSNQVGRETLNFN